MWNPGIHRRTAKWSRTGYVRCWGRKTLGPVSATVTPLFTGRTGSPAGESSVDHTEFPPIRGVCCNSLWSESPDSGSSSRRRRNALPTSSGSSPYCRFQPAGSRRIRRHFSARTGGTLPLADSMAVLLDRLLSPDSDAGVAHAPPRLVRRQRILQGFEQPIFVGLHVFGQSPN